jgi:hypothetical protein
MQKIYTFFQRFKGYITFAICIAFVWTMIRQVK